MAGRAARGYPIKRSTAVPAPTRGAAGSRGTISAEAWPRMISERRCSGGLLQSRANFHDLYDALLRQLSRTALHPRLQAHAPHHRAAHHLARTRRQFRGGWPAMRSESSREIGQNLQHPHVAPMYMAAHIARDQHRRHEWRSKAGSCMSRTSAPTRITRYPGLWRPGDVLCSVCRSCATASRSALSHFPGNECSHSTSGRSNWCAPLPTRIAIENARLLDEIRERVTASGLNSGPILAAWIAYRHPDRT